MGVTMLPVLALLAEPDVVQHFQGLMVIRHVEVEYESGELHVQ